jgi:hypothetical protein
VNRAHLGRWSGPVRGRRDGSRSRTTYASSGANAIYASSIAAPTDPATDRATIVQLFNDAAAAGATAVIDGNYTIEWGIPNVPATLPAINVPADCTLALSNARTSTLTANTTVGATVFDVTDGTKFRIGEWVVISDSNRTVQGGGNQTRRNGFASTVASIVGNTVTLTDASPYAFTTAASATMGSCTGLLYVTGSCTVTGPGTLDANRAGAYDVHPIDISTTEAERAGCALYIKPGGVAASVSNITIRGGSLHGLVLHSVIGGAASNLTCTNAHDKNLMLRGCQTTTLTDVTCTNSLFEDGVILYASNQTITLTNITATNCNRFGISIASGDTGVVLDGATITSCARAFSDKGTGSIISNVSITNCGTGQSGLVGGFGFECNGNGSGGSINGITLTGVSTFTSAALGFNTATNYTVSNVTLTKGVGSGATISAVRFLVNTTANCSATNVNNTDWRWGVRGVATSGVTSCLVSGLDTGSTTDTLDVIGIDVSGMVFV